MSHLLNRVFQIQLVLVLLITSASPINSPRTQVYQNATLALAGSYDDDFPSPTLESKWHIINEDPTRWSLTTVPGYLRIIGTKTDMWRNCGSGANLFLQDAPSGDFDIETKVLINPTTNFQQAGLLVYKDDDNYIKLNALYSRDGGQQSVEYIKEENGVVPPGLAWPHFSVDLSRPAILKISKVGATYTGYYSLDGKSWETVGSTNANITGQLRFGIYALSGFTNPDNCTGTTTDIIADFDYFRANVSLKLKLPFEHSPGDNGLGYVWSFFDHEYPVYTAEPETAKNSILLYFNDRLDYVNDCVSGVSCYSGHNGIDFSKGLNDKSAVYPAASGELTYDNTDSCYGNIIRITHGRYQTFYGHLKSDAFLRKTPGHVEVTDRIGTVGNEGTCSDGVHLHFVLYYDQNNNGIFETDEVVDPYGWRNQCANYGDPWTITFKDASNHDRVGPASKWLWEFSEPACVTVTPDAGQTITTRDNLVIDIPANAVVAPAIASYLVAPEISGTPLARVSADNATITESSTIPIGNNFQLTAVFQDESSVSSFSTPVSIVVSSLDIASPYYNVAEIVLYWWDPSIAEWVQMPTTVNSQSGMANATTTHTGLFSFRAPPKNPAPIITSVTLNKDRQVTITGTNFMPGVYVNFGISGLVTTYISPQVLTGEFPLNSAGGVNMLTVTNSDGQHTTMQRVYLSPNSVFLPSITR